MYKYELYEIDIAMSYSEKLIAKSNNLEELRKYAKKHYLYPDKDFYSAEVQTNRGFFYENTSGAYHGAPYYPSAAIRVAPSNFIIIE